MTSRKPARRPRTRRGRPHKYGRPSQVVALSLPREVIDQLRATHRDLGWAVVNLVEKTRRSQPRPRAPIAQLVEVGTGASLIVVNPTAIRHIPAVRLIPLSDHEAFLALAPGQGMADLEIAVIDQLERLPRDVPERRATQRLRDQLRAWRRDRRLAFASQAIVLATRVK